MIDRSVTERVDFSDAVRRELSYRNRLLPRRWDHLALAIHHEDVEAWLRPQLRRGPTGRLASVVFADKGFRGARPLHMMTLQDRVLYRALTSMIAESLPEPLRERCAIEEFRQAPLEVPGVKYVSKTDVTAYYEFVDHELLSDELISQTGEELAVDALSDLLGSVMGRRVGLPQVHTASDVLGDTYIDPVRRRMLRNGHEVFTYSDDFRIASTSLGSARAAIEACAAEVRKLGLVLNERKTYTYGVDNYRRSLTSFADAEQRLFSVGEPDPLSLGFLDSDYGDEDSATSTTSTLGVLPLDRGVDEDEALVTDDAEQIEVDANRLSAAGHAWDLWVEEDESEEAQARQDAAITQSLVGRALPALGAAGDERPLGNLAALLRYEPALTPQVAAYIAAYAATSSRARANLRGVLDDIVRQDIFSAWQGMWLAQAAGGVRRAQQEHAYEAWLTTCASDAASDGLAATAAAALGRIGRGDPDILSAAIERVGPEWRRLVFWGLIGVDRQKAAAGADDELDRLLLAATL